MSKSKKEIHIGQKVEIIQKNGLGTKKLSPGAVKKVVSKTQKHPLEWEVELKTGEIRYVKIIHLN